MLTYMRFFVHLLVTWDFWINRFNQSWGVQNLVLQLLHLALELRTSLYPRVIGVQLITHWHLVVVAAQGVRTILYPSVIVFQRLLFLGSIFSRGSKIGRIVIKASFVNSSRSSLYELSFFFKCRLLSYRNCLFHSVWICLSQFSWNSTRTYRSSVKQGLECVSG